MTSVLRRRHPEENRPTEDHYFIGRMGLENELEDRDFAEAVTQGSGGFLHKILGSVRAIKPKHNTNVVGMRGNL